MSMSVNEARVLFANWLKSTDPALFDAAYKDAEQWRKSEAEQSGDPATISGLGANGEPQSFWERFTTGLTNLATGVLAYKSQKQILETNIQRAEQGLPPIDPATAGPVLRTQVEVTPEIAARLQQTAAEGARTMLLWGGALVLGYFLLFRRR